MAREVGFCAAARDRSIEVVVERYGSTTYQSGVVLAARLLERKQRPDAIFCANDLIACGLMDAARHRYKLAVPDDLCVIGFDNIEQSAWSSYELTTFAQPVDEIAVRAVEWLSEHGPGEIHSHRLGTQLIWRGSVREARPQ
jgi:DNA-binding LacI/PurR family transcriptional regulator